MTREEAQALGLPRYQGKPCKHNHDGVRYTANRACCACNDLIARRPKYRTYYRVAAKERQQTVREYIRFLKSGPCSDCGKRYPWYVMEFDHVQGRHDRLTISDLLGYGIEKVKYELEDCDVVCANCHRIRTHLRAVAAGRRSE